MPDRTHHRRQGLFLPVHRQGRLARILSGVATDRPATDFGSEGVIRHLRGLTAALDGRMPRLERRGTCIAEDAKARRTKALQRIVELDRT